MVRPDIRLRDVIKRYGSALAVDNVTLDIQKGEFLTLLGPSGCGKTTTLNMIAGFVTPSSGAIYIKDRSVTDLPPFERDTGMVFQSYALFPHMTVFDNVAFGLRMRRVDAKEVQRRVGEALERVHLAGYGDRYPRQLSGGQQQRVALARAIVVRPAVLLLDEPLSNLDLKLREAMRLELKNLQRDLGITSVYVTHDQGEALTMSDRIAVMNAGKIEQLGSPEAIYDSPATLFVARFVGATNVLSGTVVSLNRSEAEVRLDADGAVVRTRSTQPLAVGSKVAVSVRPEKCRLAVGGDFSTMNSLTAHVRETIVAGTELEYLLELEGSLPFVVKALNADESLRPTGGDKLVVSFPVHHCLSFPVAEEKEPLTDAPLESVAA